MWVIVSSQAKKADILAITTPKALAMIQKHAMKKNVIVDATIVAANAAVMIVTAQENLKIIAATKNQCKKRNFL